MRNKMRAKTRNFFTGFAIIFALILIAFPSSAATSGGVFPSLIIQDKQFMI